MACFVVPLAEAVAVSLLKKKCDKFKSLSQMLWAGAIVLGIEHIVRGESLWNLSEMAYRGVLMSVAVTSLWVLLSLVAKPTRSFLSNAIANALMGIVLMYAIDFIV